jgi:hypothetical protein
MIAILIFLLSFRFAVTAFVGWRMDRSCQHNKKGLREWSSS